MWDSVAPVELCEAFLDFRKEHQTLNRVVDRGIWRQFANRFNHLIPRDAMWHTTLIYSWFFRRIAGEYVGPTLALTSRRS